MMARMRSFHETVTFDGEGLRLDTAEDAQQVVDELRGRVVKTFILQGNTIGIEAAEHIGNELTRHSELEEAYFKDIFTSRGKEEVPIAMNHLLQGINSSDSRLKLLDLSDNAIGPVTAPSLIAFLETPAAKCIEKLYVNNCGLGPEGSSSISPHIGELNQLRELVIGRNRLEDLGAANLSRALCELNTLEVLRLPQNGINVKGIQNLVDALLANIDTIKEIDLSDNTIKSKGAYALGSALIKANKLSVLKLDDALLKNSGFSMICDALSKSQALATMKEVSFEGNELRGPAVVELIEYTFTNCPDDVTVNLAGNEFRKEELQRLEALQEKIEIAIDDPSDVEDYSDEEDDDESESESDESSGDETEDDSENEDGFGDDNGFKRII